MDFSLKKDYKISEEAAYEQLMNILRYYDFEIEVYGSDDKPKIEVELRKIIQAIRDGKVEVAESDKGCHFVQHLSKEGEEPITYSGSLSKAKSAMDGRDPKAIKASLLAFAGSITNLGVGGVKRLGDKDYQIMEMLSSFLLLVAS